MEKANAFVVHANTLLKVESLPSLAITDNSLVRLGKTHLVVLETIPLPFSIQLISFWLKSIVITYCK